MFLHVKCLTYEAPVFYHMPYVPRGKTTNIIRSPVFPSFHPRPTIMYAIWTVKNHSALCLLVFSLFWCTNFSFLIT